VGVQKKVIKKKKKNGKDAGKEKGDANQSTNHQLRNEPWDCWEGRKSPFGRRRVRKTRKWGGMRCAAKGGKSQKKKEPTFAPKKTQADTVGKGVQRKSKRKIE